MRYLFYLLLFFPFFLAANEHILQLEMLGSVRYVHDGKRVSHIDRLLPDGTVFYTHTYKYNEQGNLISENLIGNLGEIIHDANSTVSPYSYESYEYDENQNVTCHIHDETEVIYSYNEKGELISSDPTEDFEYDISSNLVRKGDAYYEYDSSHKLVRFTSGEDQVDYIYDSDGRLSSQKTNGKTESYFYFLDNNIGGIIGDDGLLKELRIPGSNTHYDILRPIAIETKDTVYAPIYDRQGNLFKLINIFSREVIPLPTPDPFGRGLAKESPTSLLFSGKQYDPVTDLIYFGHRFYSPSLKKWLTPDPAMQSSDPYEYCLNNPFRYVDPDGRFALTFANLAFGAASVLSFPLVGPSALAIAAGAAFGYIAYETVQALNDSSFWKNTEVYAPDRSLPSDKDGIPIPDVDAPHTQLGTKESKRRKGQTYPQAREFDENGNPVRTIDFTDHNRSDHLNPHQHRHIENPTGGTKTRDDPEPLPDWSYNED